MKISFASTPPSGAEQGAEQQLRTIMHRRIGRFGPSHFQTISRTQVLFTIGTVHHGRPGPELLIRDISHQREPSKKDESFQPEPSKRNNDQ
jgi:hypothetical protein